MNRRKFLGLSLGLAVLAVVYRHPAALLAEMELCVGCGRRLWRGSRAFLLASLGHDDFADYCAACLIKMQGTAHGTVDELLTEAPRESREAVYVAMWKPNMQADYVWMAREDYLSRSRRSPGSVRLIREGLTPVREILRGALEASGRRMQ